MAGSPKCEFELKAWVAVASAETKMEVIWRRIAYNTECITDRESKQ